jgi:mono/diheme cytochrome c family protein
MLSTIAPVVAGLSSGHKLGLAAVGVAFILFALVSSFVLPRRNPNFPGKNMGWYVALCVLFFVAMLSAVLVFGKEGKEVAGESPVHTETRSGSLPGQTSSTDSTPTTTTTASGGSSSNGNATAGKQVFATAGCGGCHTLKAAGSTGNVGPNLDDLKPDEQTVAHQVTVGGGPMPAYKGQLSDQQIQDVAAYVSSSAGS